MPTMVFVFMHHDVDVEKIAYFIIIYSLPSNNQVVDEAKAIEASKLI